MFSGIVETTGVVRTCEGGRLVVSVPWPESDLRIGQSIAVSGCCLTVVRIQEGTVEFDVSPETFDRTTFGVLRTGNQVNLERGLRLGDALDGHMVSGHVDTKGGVRKIRELADGCREFWFDVPSSCLRWVVEKGCVSVDGISLTVCGVDVRGFSVVLIPHTLAITTFGECREGDQVNVEFDLLAKYVEKLLGPRGSR